MAHVDEFVNNLPEKYETLTGERGIALSGGQRQRIAIARAMIKVIHRFFLYNVHNYFQDLIIMIFFQNPSILILDEATSALDANSEYLVKEALKGVYKNRTVLTIAHRLSTIQTADQIAVLQNGKIVELGTFKELLDIQGGVFNELIHRAFHDL